MPLVRNLGRNVDEWCRRTSKPHSNWHVCRGCLRAHGRHGLAGMLTPYNGDPSGFGGIGPDTQKTAQYKDAKLTCAVCATVLVEGDE